MIFLESRLNPRDGTVDYLFERAALNEADRSREFDGSRDLSGVYLRPEERVDWGRCLEPVDRAAFEYPRPRPKAPGLDPARLPE